MAIAEVIGLCLMLLAFVLPAIGKAVRRNRQRKRLTPEQARRIDEQEEEIQYRQYEEFLRAIGANDEVQELRKRRAQQLAAAEPPPPPSPPPTPPVVRKEVVAPVSHFHAPLDEHHMKDEISQREQIAAQRFRETEDNAYSLEIGTSPARIRQVLSRPKALREMVLAREIIDRPRSERYEPHW